MKNLLLLVVGLSCLMTTYASDTSAAAGRPPVRVAMIFDDGPEPEQGPRLQGILQREGVRVTFAHVGRNVEQHPKVTAAAVAAGHEIVNHSYSHAQIAGLDREEVRQEVFGGRQAIAAVLGRPPHWYWPPYLALDDRLRAFLRAADQPLYVPHRLVDPKDWDRQTTAEQIRERSIQGVEDGTVLLFHEWRQETVDQIPAIIAALREQGCVFLTFSELEASLREKPPASAPDTALQARFAGAAEKSAE